ncbi:MAG: LamG-like jellyroll fold domain-containing protein [bacterium]
MSIHAKEQEVLKELIDTLLEERATPEQDAQLEKRLKADPAAREFYVKYMHLHARMLWRYRGESEHVGTFDEKEEPVAPVTVPYQEATRFPLRWLALAASVALLLGVGAVLRFQSQGGRQEVTGRAFVSRPDEVATLVNAVKCLWGTSRQATAVGTRLTCGTVQLVQGLCEIEFDSGARMILEGPSVLEIQSRDRAFLRTGAVTCMVPKKAIGFVVQTPSSRVVDFGTEFGIRAEESGASQVHTFTGLVKVESSQELMEQISRTGDVRNATELLAGQQLQIDADGRATLFSTNSVGEGFVRSLPKEEPQDVRNSYARLVLADRPVGFWRFEEEAMSNNTVTVDCSGLRRAGSYHGNVRSVPGVPGIGGRAACFDGSSALMRVPHDAGLSLNSLSVEFWICTSENWSNTYWPGDAVLVSKDVPGLGADWSLAGGSFTPGQNEGRVIVGIGSQQEWRSPTKKEDQLMGSLFRINDGVWHHLVWTRDSAGANRLYVDGVVAVSMDDSGGPINNPMDIEVGGCLRSAKAGVSVRPLDEKGKELNERSFLDGKLDELAIYDHVLSPEQVSAHYRAGK